MADKAIRKGYTKRYLPESAWAKLSKEEREKALYGGVQDLGYSVQFIN